MNRKQISCVPALAFPIALPVKIILLSVVLLTLAWAPARTGFEQKPCHSGMALRSTHTCVNRSERSAISKGVNAPNSDGVEFSAARQRVGGREIAGFSARQADTAQAENLTPPAGLKPVEQQAWLAMAHRRVASGSCHFSSFYPARYGEPFVVEGEGLRVAVRPVGGTDAAAQITNGKVVYKAAYADTDSMHEVRSGRSEEFLFLQDECAPREFAYELSELSAGARVELVNGAVRFTNKAGRGVKIEAPWLIEANGALRADAVHWELDAANSVAGPQLLRLIVAKGLRYPVVIDPSWTTTGSLSTARYSHTATLLQSGKVLVAGGAGSSGSLNSAELYDPTAGTWTATGSLVHARYSHTATLLQSGKVLVAGGINGTAVLSSAELYDPSAGTWTSTSAMNNKRVDHTATLLPSGKVLVAGGTNGTGLLSAAELYDPASGIWTATGSMRNARELQTTTLLQSGEVLVAGGVGSGTGTLSAAELYDPAAGTWTATGSLGTAREFHTATLLPSGDVLVVGGTKNGSDALGSAELYDPIARTWAATGTLNQPRAAHTASLLPSGGVLVAGGTSNGSDALSSAELYDPAAGTWAAIASLSDARDAHTATLLPSGKVLVAGGYNGGPLSSAELYDPASGTWTATGNLAAARRRHTATLLPSGEVLVAGGYNGSDYLSSAELYDPASGKWTPTGSLAHARTQHTATLLSSGKVLVAGGYNGSAYLSSAELYDPATGAWTATGSLTNARSLHTATLLPTGRVLVAGGTNNGSGALKSVEWYDPATGTWTEIEDLLLACYQHTATLLPSGRVLVAGGTTGTKWLNDSEVFNPATGIWADLKIMNFARANHTATLLPSGKVLAAGGYDGNEYLGSAELYDPAASTWTDTGGMSTPRANQTATLLPSGKVLVAGGFDGGVVQTSAEVYDPVNGTWTDTAVMTTHREYQTATLLPSGAVLEAGGESNDLNALNSAELFDQGLGFNSDWQPSLDTVSLSTSSSGSALTASGSGFQGISEGSGGNGAQNSSSNYPLVQLLSLVNEQTLFLPADSATSWSDSSFTSTPITLMTTSSTGFPIGYALVTVFTNGIPSQSQFVAMVTSSQISNVSTRAFTQTGDNVIIGGFTVQGAEPKKVIIRAIGPELHRYDVPDRLGDPTLELHDGSGALIGSNDSWLHTIIGGIITSDQVDDITNSGHAPRHPRESAIIAELPAGNYTAIVRGANNTTGVALIEVYDVSLERRSALRNVSTRAFAETDDHVMIGGFIVQGTRPKKIIVRAIGPELSQYGVANTLGDPTLELHDGTGALIASNDNWQHTIFGGIITGDQVQAIRHSGHAPGDPRESAIIADLPPGNYTGIVRGNNNMVGVALVEAYDLDQ
ncbi:MAG TPA: kelch repeat-containing protein [Candidatus Udaeobacter sp.]